MQPAPAVSLPCGDAGGWRTAGLLLTASVAAALAAWIGGWAWPLPDTRWTLPLAALAGLAAAAVQARRAAPPPGTLHWDTQTWQFLPAPGAAAQPGTVRVAIDLGGWMLLRFRPEDGGAAVWLPVGAAASAAARTALFAAHRPASPSAAAGQGAGR